MDAIVQFFGYFNFGGGSSTTASSSIPSPAAEAAKKLVAEEERKAKNVGTKEAAKVPPANKAQLLAERRRMIGSKCQTFYASDPFIVSRASMQYLFDENGDRFLDCISNVQHVGHCHPHVVSAICSQLALSTCNIRFLSPVLTDCARALLATLPPELDTLLFCNSGSEANDLALQLARDWSGGQHMIVLENAYHGHITTAVQMSPYKFEHGANIRKPDWIHIAPAPDVYRGRHQLSDEDRHCAEKQRQMGQLYAEEVSGLLEQIGQGNVAGFIAEALQSCGGQVIPPAGYFPAVAQAVHARGGLVIVDEVQTGFGRVGSTFWAHQLNDRDFVPDIVTMGKPMGNGHPVAAVATRKAIADMLCGGAEYFNTYGGNPVSCAAVLAVLEVIEREQLLAHSQRMGQRFEQELCGLKAKHSCIGDVRGVGMFWGLDLVRSRQTREPDPQLAARLILRLRQNFRVLLNADGPHANILKFKPPLCFGPEDLAEAVRALDAALGELEREKSAEEFGGEELEG